MPLSQKINVGNTTSKKTASIVVLYQVPVKESEFAAQRSGW
jgi:hypothetical protein